jgi:uncharacterized membrane protein
MCTNTAGAAAKTKTALVATLTFTNSLSWISISNARGIIQKVSSFVLAFLSYGCLQEFFM